MGQAYEHFYPRTPCGVRLPVKQCASPALPFLSTYPVRGTTKARLQKHHGIKISIHVPRAGYDHAASSASRQPGHFYPRTPCGVRRVSDSAQALTYEISIHVPRAGYDGTSTYANKDALKFLSTYPVRGTTHRLIDYPRDLDISIHVPRAGYDQKD